MFRSCLLFSIILPIIVLNAQSNNEIKPPGSSTGTNVHVVGRPFFQSASGVSHMKVEGDQSTSDKRTRRQIIEVIQTAGVVISVAKAFKNTESGEEILGMAKKVAIAVIVIVSLCIVCCLMTTVVVCVKCCSNGNNRKRNRGQSSMQVPQPIFVQTSPAGYQPQYYQQQAPSVWSPSVVQTNEVSPMLPQPSAPPRPQDYFHTEHPPPPYEKVFSHKQ